MRNLTGGIAAAALACVVALGVVPQVALAQALPEFPADALVLVEDEATGEVLVEQGADERAYPASLTKMMTALVALDEVGDRLDERVTVGEEVSLTPYDSTVMGLEEGDSFSWRELLYGMLIPSGSDSALVIATHVGRLVAGDEGLPADGAIGVFVDLMNRKADELGMSGTHFANVHGFHDDAHYTTARDLLVLARAVRANELLRDITGTATYSCTSAEGRELTVYSTNWLLDETAGELTSDGLLFDEGRSGVANPYYRAAATGIKTGYTGEAGRCLAFSCAGGIDAIGVVLRVSDQPTMYTLMDGVVDAIGASYEHRTWEATTEPATLELSNASLLDRIRGNARLSAVASEPVTGAVDTTCSYEERVVWDSAYVAVPAEGAAELATVVGDGTQVATVQILRDGEVVREVPLLVTHALTPFGNRDIALIVVVAVAVVAVVLVVALRASSRRRERRRREVARRAAKEARRREERGQQRAARRPDAAQPSQRRAPSHMRR